MGSEIFKSQYTGEQIEQMLANISLQQEILYDLPVEQTNYGDITLDKNFTDYDVIEIFAATDDKHLLYNKFEKSINGLQVNFSASLLGGANYFTKSKVYEIQDNQLKLAYIKNWSTGESVMMSGLWGTHNTSSFERKSEVIGIYKIIGYKYIT